jgi:hypothetical protein
VAAGSPATGISTSRLLKIIQDHPR